MSSGRCLPSFDFNNNIVVDEQRRFINRQLFIAYRDEEVDYCINIVSSSSLEPLTGKELCKGVSQLDTRNTNRNGRVFEVAWLGNSNFGMGKADKHIGKVSSSQEKSGTRDILAMQQNPF